MSFRLEHRIGVAAPVGVVWNVIADFARWGEWNPFHPEIEGELRIGAALRLRQVTPGEAPEIVGASLIDWVPDAQLVWAAKYGGGLVRGAHFLEIESLTPTGCIVANGEVYSGLATRLVGKGLRRRLRAGLVATSEALKARAEAEHRESVDA